MRSLALFFLLFTAGDLTMPQYFCGEEMGGLPDAISYPATTSNLPKGNEVVVIAASGSENSSPDLPSDQKEHEEDCFCCCAHVLPGTSLLNVTASDLELLPSAYADDSLPVPHLRGTYHPPRFA